MSTNPLHPPHPNHPPDIKPTVAPCGCFFDPRAGCRYTCDQHVVPLAVDMAAALHLADQSGSSAASNSMALTDAEWEILFAAESPPVKEVQPALDEEASTLPVLTIGPATLQPMPTASPPPPVNSHVNQPERQRTLQFRPPLPSTSALHSSPTGLVQAHHATSSPTAHSVTMSPGSDTSQSEGASEEDLGSEEDYDLVIGEPRPFQTAAEELLKMAPPTAGVLPPKQLDYLPPFPCHPVPKSHVIWVYIVRYKLIKHVVLLEPLDDRVCSLLSDLRWYSAELDFCQAQSNELIGFEAECWRNTITIIGPRNFTPEEEATIKLNLMLLLYHSGALIQIQFGCTVGAGVRMMMRISRRPPVEALEGIERIVKFICQIYNPDLPPVACTFIKPDMWGHSILP